MYTWKTGLFGNVDANKVYNELAYYGLEDGLYPEEIVEKAKDESTELHKCFTWDDTEAAQKWRVQEARQVCASLVIEVEHKDPTVPTFSRVIEVTKSGYKPVEVIMKNEDEYAELLRRAKNELISFQNRYLRLSELTPVFNVIKELV